jgi:hypothetical protein
MSVLRYKLQVTDTLYSKKLDSSQAESQAAKIFAKWLKEHPKYSVDDVDMCIKSYGQEEDYMGHFGHISKYVRIFKRREETDSEYNARIAKEESEALDKFRNKLYFIIKDLINDFSIYPNMDSDEIDAHVNSIENAVMDIVKEKINKSNKKK